jgi:hypothetical protein
MTDKPPEARQDRDPESHTFGAVAVQAKDQITGEPRPGVYGYIHPANGGGWLTAEDVEDWEVLS